MPEKHCQTDNENVPSYLRELRTSRRCKAYHILRNCITSDFSESWQIEEQQKALEYLNMLQPQLESNIQQQQIPAWSTQSLQAARQNLLNLYRLPFHVTLYKKIFDKPLSPLGKLLQEVDYISPFVSPNTLQSMVASVLAIFSNEKPHKHAQKIQEAKEHAIQKKQLPNWFEFLPNWTVALLVNAKLLPNADPAKPKNIATAIKNYINLFLMSNVPSTWDSLNELFNSNTTIPADFINSIASIISDEHRDSILPQLKETLLRAGESYAEVGSGLRLLIENHNLNGASIQEHKETLLLAGQKAQHVAEGLNILSRVSILDTALGPYCREVLVRAGSKAAQAAAGLVRLIKSESIQQNSTNKLALRFLATEHQREFIAVRLSEWYRTQDDYIGKKQEIDTDHKQNLNPVEAEDNRTTINKAYLEKLERCYNLSPAIDANGFLSDVLRICCQNDPDNHETLLDNIINFTPIEPLSLENSIHLLAELYQSSPEGIPKLFAILNSDIFRGQPEKKKEYLQVLESLLQQGILDSTNSLSYLSELAQMRNRELWAKGLQSLQEYGLLNTPLTSTLVRNITHRNPERLEETAACANRMKMFGLLRERVKMQDNMNALHELDFNEFTQRGLPLAEVLKLILFQQDTAQANFDGFVKDPVAAVAIADVAKIYKRLNKITTHEKTHQECIQMFLNDRDFFIIDGAEWLVLLDKYQVLNQFNLDPIYDKLRDLSDNPKLRTLLPPYLKTLGEARLLTFASIHVILDNLIDFKDNCAEKMRGAEWLALLNKSGVVSEVNRNHLFVKVMTLSGSKYDCLHDLVPIYLDLLKQTLSINPSNATQHLDALITEEVSLEQKRKSLEEKIAAMKATIHDNTTHARKIQQVYRQRVTASPRQPTPQGNDSPVEAPRPR